MIDYIIAVPTWVKVVVVVWVGGIAWLLWLVEHERGARG